MEKKVFVCSFHQLWSIEKVENERIAKNCKRIANNCKKNFHRRQMYRKDLRYYKTFSCNETP
jgi:hypothetical protein